MNGNIQNPPISHSLSTEQLGEVQCFVFEDTTGRIATALVLGDIKSGIVPIVRIHSRCLYAETFGSLDCDCKAQLDLSLQIIKEEGTGVLIYLEQEGRGCGLVNKAKAYLLKEDNGLDTVEAYRALGLSVDARSYDAAINILRHLQLSSIRLLTNNPQKVSALNSARISVQQVPLRTTPTEGNIDYLRVKQDKLGHDLGLK